MTPAEALAILRARVASDAARRPDAPAGVERQDPVAVLLEDIGRRLALLERK